MAQIDTTLDFKLFEDANCCAKTGVWSTDMFTVADPGWYAINRLPGGLTFGFLGWEVQVFSA